MYTFSNTGCRKDTLISTVKIFWWLAKGMSYLLDHLLSYNDYRINFGRCGWILNHQRSSLGQFYFKNDFQRDTWKIMYLRVYQAQSLLTLFLNSSWYGCSFVNLTRWSGLRIYGNSRTAIVELSRLVHLIRSVNHTQNPYCLQIINNCKILGD